MWAAAYLPFGKAQVTTETVANNLRFPGQYYDAESGLHYNRHRYYDPETGRYITADPIGLEGGINLYAYVMGNPINFIDPSGLQTPVLPPYRILSPEQTERLNYVLFQATGDFLIRAFELRRWGHDTFQREQNSAMRHCVVSCILTREYNYPVTYYMGAANEWYGGLERNDIPLIFRALTGTGTIRQQRLGEGRLDGTVPWAFQAEDFYNNEKGFECAGAGSGCDNGDITADCIKCCMRKTGR